MGTQLKNIILILGLVTVIFGGYYLYISQNDAALDAENSEQALQNMLADTAVFITYSQELDQINLDLSVFEDERFDSLQLFTKPVESQPAGHNNPFGEGGE